MQPNQRKTASTIANAGIILLPTVDAISVHGTFCQASLELGPSGQELRTPPTGQLAVLVEWV